MRAIQIALSPARLEPDNLIEKRNSLHEIQKQSIVCDGLNQQISSYNRMISDIEEQIVQKKRKKEGFYIHS